MSDVLKSMRLNIGLFGKRNVGKSALLNYIAGQDVSIVSDTKGTTTDAVEKVMELLPIGPVVLIDTAGIDDTGSLGSLRTRKTFEIMNKINLALIVCDERGFDEFEEELVDEFLKLNTPFAVVINKNDKEKISSEKLLKIKRFTQNIISINTKNSGYIDDIKNLILKIMPDNFFDEERILNDIIFKSDSVVQVIPIDKAAPKGRLILPQVRIIRNLLDIGANSIITTVENLKYNISNLKNKPKLVITDSQVFKEVAEIVGDEIPLTSYSIIFARLKGDLKIFVNGAKTISKLDDDDKVLICEACSHPATCDDIGRVKIPSLLEKFTGKKLQFEFSGGHDFPENLKQYKLIIHCGGCMINKKEIYSRIIRACDDNVPVTNYGIAIAYCSGIAERATSVFIGN